VWIDPDAIESAPSVMGTPVKVVGPDGVAELSLREVFGDTSYRLVRVIAVQQVVDDTPGGELIGKLWRFCEKLQERLAESTTVQRINLLVPGGEVITAKGMLEPDCDINMVVSPEDRPGEGAADLGIERPEVFDPHSALACATVGALWLHAGSGAFDRQDGMRTGRRGQIVVTRAYARGIDGRELPDDVAKTLLSDGIGSLGQYLPDRANRTASDEKLVEAAYHAFLPIDRNVMSYRGPRREQPAPSRHIVPRTFGMLFRFMLQIARRNLMQWQREFTVRLEDAAEKWLDWVTTAEEDRWLRPYPTSEDMLELAAEAPPSMQDNPLMPGAAPIYPHLWPPLRELCFGLLDDGALPEEMRAQWNTLQPGVSDPRWIAPTPEAHFYLADGESRMLDGTGLVGHEIRPGDSNAVHRLERELRKAG
ncbi:MAG: hypothetical protein ACREX8_10335, partial [Gammaproteobacteria bacterium]